MSVFRKIRPWNIRLEGDAVRPLSYQVAACVFLSSTPDHYYRSVAAQFHSFHGGNLNWMPVPVCLCYLVLSLLLLLLLPPAAAAAGGQPMLMVNAGNVPEIRDNSRTQGVFPHTCAAQRLTHG